MHLILLVKTVSFCQNCTNHNLLCTQSIFGHFEPTVPPPSMITIWFSVTPPTIIPSGNYVICVDHLGKFESVCSLIFPTNHDITWKNLVILHSCYNSSSENRKLRDKRRATEYHVCQHVIFDQ